MKSTANRRNWLKSGLLTIGAFAFSPHLSMSGVLRKSTKDSSNKDFQHSPFFKEFTPKEILQINATSARLFANENPYGPSPLALKAFTKNAFTGNRYAWEQLFSLIDKIAKKEGVSSKNILMGPGSSDLLEKFGMALFLNGGNIVSADPSYMSMIKVAEATGASWKAIPLKKDWSHDLETMESAIDEETKLVYICNPNNPTGSMTDHEKLLAFCSRVSDKVPVFVDEAYLDFLPDAQERSMVSLVSQGKNVIVARTFSKIYGMAGLRVGYVVGLPETLEKITRFTRAGMGLTLPSIYAAIAAMDDQVFTEKSRTLNAETIQYVYDNLKPMGVEYVESYTNFIIFPIQMDGNEFLTKMQSEKVGVRAFEFMNKNWCRVSMGTMDEMKLFIQAFKKVTA
jgi:histidinol-phosphate aminotransferase